ncbi:MAG: hypothetical protein KDA68_11500 [Planctomycetaceae bacterium]|nr:hypothetical protein [Planctomycetaceae bacterium]
MNQAPTPQPKAKTHRTGWLVAGAVLLIVAFFAWQRYRTHERYRMINDWTHRGIQVTTRQNIPIWFWKLGPSAFQNHVLMSLFPTVLTEIESYPLHSDSDDTSSILSKAELLQVMNFGDLRHLALKASPFDDELFGKISHLKKLTMFDLGGNMQEVGEHFDALLKCPHLTTLGLRKMKITPNGFKTLKTHPAIETLNLDESEFSDGDFLELIELKSLKVISIRRTKVSKEAYRSFRKARPNVYVRINNIGRENPSLEYGFLY